MNRFNQILVAGILLLIPLRAMQAMDTNSPAGHGAFQPGPEDPFLWLEDIHGARAIEWVKAQNAKATDRLQADADYRTDYDAILKVLDATDRIPFGNLDHNFVFNFWQDAGHSKGIWRRTTIADYTNAQPHWETLLDLDKLAADEKENWVWEGAVCAPVLRHCLINLSRGGGDAVVVREFDLGSKTFMKDGFALAEAKTTITYLDDDSVLDRKS